MTDDAAFFKQLLETFKIEANEHIIVLNDGLIELEKDFSNAATPEKLETIYREAHSLKGAARAVDLESIQNICQAFENVLSKLKMGEIGPSKELFQTGFEALDFIKILLEAPSEQPQDAEEYTQFINSLNAISEGSPPEGQQTKPPKEVQEEPKPEPPAEVEEEPKPEPPAEVEEEPKPEAPVAVKEEPKTPPKESEKKPQDATQSGDKLLRVSSSKLDALIVQIEELLAIKIMYSQLQDTISKTNETVQNTVKLEKQLGGAKQFVRHRVPSSEPYYEHLNLVIEELGTTVSETLNLTSTTLDKLHKDVTKDKHVVDNTIAALLEDTKKLLMQPFSTILEAFPRMVRDLSGELNKEIDLVIEGETVEIDRRILEEMKDPFMHMVRNSVDHGIESPEEREKGGKDKRGKVTIAISQVGGNHVDMTLSDDGGGFPLDTIKAKALSEGVIKAEELENMTEDDIIKLAFQSGVSSAQIITELSGRGLGLGIMAEKIEKMGGSFAVHTEKGKGTSFQLTLPLTIATFRGIQILSGDREFIIPTQNIQRILQKGGYEISTVENQKILFLENRNYPFGHLSDLMKLPVTNEPEPRLVLLVSSGTNNLAIGIEKIINEQEVFIKGLGKQLEHIPNISAATIHEGGKIIPILDVTDLVKSAISAPTHTKITHDTEESVDLKTILVAEDTMTTRLLFKNILEGAGYKVITASDGAEAYNTLLDQKIDLLVTDIEMPKMTGFELIAKIHETDKIKETPVIIITACETAEDKKKGIELGANAYIEKSSFVQNELLTITKKLL
jgi:two-component system, chemotaxis family, sensor kinase CheA